MREQRAGSLHAGERGQSTVEFALMIPVVMTIFFWIFQANIYIAGMHQVGYASFAAARAHTVERQGTSCPPGGGCEQEVADAILTGKIYQNNVGGPPVASESTRQGRSANWGKTDGARVNAQNFNSLPYVRGIMRFDMDVPTHLGPAEFDVTVHDGNQRGMPGTRKRFTDNNIEDFD